MTQQLFIRWVAFPGVSAFEFILTMGILVVLACLVSAVLPIAYGHTCDSISGDYNSWLGSARNTEVVVIGGGAAGLSAAKTLIQERVPDIVLLEAQDYLGGRVKTDRQGSIITEDGAEWINGGRDNRLYDLARSLDGLTHPIPDYLYDWRVKTQDGRNADVNGYDVAANLFDVCERDRVLRQYHDFGYGKCYADKFAGKYTYFRARRSEKYAWLHYLEMWVNKDTGLNDWMDQSARDADHFTDWGRDEWNQWADGYDTLIDYLKKDIPSDKIKLSTPVCKIFWGVGDDNKVLVVTRNGTSYLADHVITTASIAHLKDRRDQLFDPPLPRGYRDAMDVTELGIADKIQLGWDSPWWSSSPLSLNIIFTEDLPSDKAYLMGIMEFMTIHQQKNMLQAFIVGDNARKMEDLPEDKVKEDVLWLLRRVTGQDVPNTTSFKRTQWGKNEWTLGAYNSYVTVVGGNTNMRDRSPLTKAVYKNGKPLLLWAGEHTHSTRYGTVDGAMDTGEWQAYKVLDYMDTIY